MGGSRVTKHGLFMMSPCPYRGRIRDHVYLSIDSIASMFAVLLPPAGCHCVSPLMFPSYWSPSLSSLPRSLSVNESPLPGPDSDGACPSCRRLRRLILSPSSLVTGCTILHTRSKWILMAPICFTAPTTNLLSLFTSLLKLQLSRIWKCNQKRHCFLWTDFLSWLSVFWPSFTISPSSFCQVSNHKIWN